MRVEVADPRDGNDLLDPFKAVDANATDEWRVVMNGEVHLPDTMRVYHEGNWSVKTSTEVVMHWDDGKQTVTTVDQIERVEWSPSEE